MEKTSQLSPDIRKKIRQIELHTKRLLRGALVGDSRSAIKGTGFEFDQIRDYQLGDDVRFIDWKSSTRMNTLLIKQYIEERSRTIIIAVDVSGSGKFGSLANLKQDTIAQVASVLALVANSGKDRVGLLLFSDTIETYLPPARGRSHVQKIMEMVFAYTPQKTKTNITNVFKQFAQLKYKDMVGFIISDFIDDYLEQAYIAPICKKYDIIGIRCLDSHEQALPSLGFIPMEDPETGEDIVIDLRNGQPITNFLTTRITEQSKTYKKYGLHMFDITNNDEFVGDLIKFFRRRMRY